MFECRRWLLQACKMPAVLVLGQYQTPISCPSTEILFQWQLLCGTPVHVPTRTLYSIPSTSLVWPPTKSPHGVTYHWESEQAVGEQHRGWRYRQTAPGPRLGKPALQVNWAGSLSPQKGSAATAACENGGTRGHTWHLQMLWFVCRLWLQAGRHGNRLIFLLL